MDILETSDTKPRDRTRQIFQDAHIYTRFNIMMALNVLQPRFDNPRVLLEIFAVLALVHF